MTKFYALTPPERRAALVAAGDLSPADAAALTQPALPTDVAASLSENVIGEYALPLGIVQDLVVNGQRHQVPMVTEEPSVVAAANNGARLARLSGGVTVVTAPHRVVGEVVFTDLPDAAQAAATLAARHAALMAAAAAAHPSIIRRGGGVTAIEVTVLGERFVKLAVTIDPQEAMGANIANTILEAIGATAGAWLQAQPLVAILSNRVPALTTATVALAVDTLGTANLPGRTIARRIAQASDLAAVDLDRAVTHNKGIMNGINAAVLASGNDTRAVAAAVYAHAATAGYSPLATWRLDGPRLRGELALPLPLGVVGGAIGALPRAQQVRRLGQYDTVATLQAVVAAVGLVQNLAALRALVGPGLQAGHMALQARALAMAVGATGGEIDAVAAQHPRDEAAAKAALAAIRKESL